MQEFFFWFPPGVFGEWKAGDKEFIWNEAATGLRGKVIFMGVETDEDASKIASMPLAGVFIDEPSAAAGEGTGVSEFVFDTAFAQLRQPGMNWYAAKLAQNNPDESHWTYRRFWDPGTPATGLEHLPEQQDPGFKAWQTREPENVHNLPSGYYERMERTWAHRPDLLRRFVEGKHGYQQVGKPVTPEWNDELHLAKRMEPVEGADLQLLWDGGLNPTCIITQVTPMGDWYILEAHVGEGIGVYELITDVIKPRIVTKYSTFDLRHIGDPSMDNREQSSSNTRASRVITQELGGPFIPGVKEMSRVDPLRSVLRRTRHGRGIVRVDKDNAQAVWWALRGGWHYHITRSGQDGGIPKNIHSHPGDACFPPGTLVSTPNGAVPINDLRPGDTVLTPWAERTVLAAKQTNVATELISIETACGRCLWMTPDHKVFTSAGLIRADAISYGMWVGTDSLWERMLWHIRKKLNSTGTRTGFRGAITDGVIGGRLDRPISIGRFGNTIMERFRWGIIFTTRTVTRSIMTLAISNVSTAENTTHSIHPIPTPGRTATAIDPTSKKSGNGQQRGTEVRKGGDGTTNMENGRGKTGRPISIHANNVGLSTKHDIEGPSGSARRSVPPSGGAITGWTTKIVNAWSAVRRFALIGMKKRGRVTRVVRQPCDPTPVYDLTVDVDHCYYAEGVLVSNCSYGASILFPLGKLRGKAAKAAKATPGGYYNTAPGTSLGMARPGARLPKAARKIGK